MRVTETIIEQIKDKLGPMHRGRRRTVLLAIKSVLLARNVTLTGMGRALASLTGISEKHGIKRIDRLLGNPRLWSDIDRSLRHLADEHFTEQRLYPVLVDWTNVTSEWSALVASVPSQGRSQVVYFETHPRAAEGNPIVQHGFLDGLYRTLRGRPGVVVITDPGFRGPWFRKVSALGWHFLGRLSSHVYVETGQGWQKAKTLYRDASEGVATDVGACRVAYDHPYDARVVLLKQRSKGRHGHRGENRHRVHPAMASYKKYRKRHQDPWLLATSLAEASTQAVVDFYQSRMQCEETFRDHKSHRFGFCLQDVAVSSPQRLRVLLFIAAIAHRIGLCIGKAVQDAGLAATFQANSLKTSRVLSWFFLGIRFIHRTLILPDTQRLISCRTLRLLS